MRHFDSDALAAFVMVYDLGSFTAAADQLGKTQAAVSMAISRLEDKLGKRLLERSRGRVRLTPAGERLIGYARKIREVEEEALAALVDRAGEARVRLGMPDDFISLFGDALIHRFGPRNRHIHIDLYCDFSRQLEAMIETCSLDVAVAVHNPDSPRGELLRRERQIWCTGPQGEPERDACLSLALFTEACSSRPHVVAAMERTGRPWRLAHTSSHIAGVLMAASSGNMLTVLPESAVPPGWRRLGPSDGLPDLPDLSLALMISRGNRLPARQVAAFLRREFGEGEQPPSPVSAEAAPLLG